MNKKFLHSLALIAIVAASLMKAGPARAQSEPIKDQELKLYVSPIQEEKEYKLFQAPLEVAPVPAEAMVAAPMNDAKRPAVTNETAYIQKYAGATWRDLNGDGRIDRYAGDEGPATAAFLQYPRGLSMDAAGNLYVADTSNDALRVIDKQGNINTLVGPQTPNLFPRSVSSGYFTTLRSPGDVWVDSSGGSLYVADTQNNRILIGVRNSSGTYDWGCFAGLCTPSASGNQGYSGDQGQATQAKLNGPASVVKDPEGSVFIADTNNNAIRRVAPDGIIETIAAQLETPLKNPRGLAVMGKNDLLVADTGNNVVREISLNEGAWTSKTIAGGGTVAASDTNPKGLAADLKLTPVEVAYDPRSQAVFVSDTSTYRILKLVPATADTYEFAIFAGDGRFGNSVDGSPAASADLGLVYGIAIDPAGYTNGIYVSNSYFNSTIQKISVAYVPGWDKTAPTPSGGDTSANYDNVFNLDTPLSTVEDAPLSYVETYNVASTPKPEVTKETVTYAEQPKYEVKWAEKQAIETPVEKATAKEKTATVDVVEVATEKKAEAAPPPAVVEDDPCANSESDDEYACCKAYLHPDTSAQTYFVPSNPDLNRELFNCCKAKTHNIFSAINESGIANPAPADRSACHCEQDPKDYGCFNCLTEQQVADRDGCMKSILSETKDRASASFTADESSGRANLNVQSPYGNTTASIPLCGGGCKNPTTVTDAKSYCSADSLDRFYTLPCFHAEQMDYIGKIANVDYLAKSGDSVASPKDAASYRISFPIASSDCGRVDGKVVHGSDDAHFPKCVIERPVCGCDKSAPAPILEGPPAPQPPPPAPAQPSTPTSTRDQPPSNSDRRNPDGVPQDTKPAANPQAEQPTDKPAPTDVKASVATDLYYCKERKDEIISVADGHHVKMAAGQTCPIVPDSVVTNKEMWALTLSASSAEQDPSKLADFRKAYIANLNQKDSVATIYTAHFNTSNADGSAVVDRPMDRQTLFSQITNNNVVITPEGHMTMASKDGYTIFAPPVIAAPQTPSTATGSDGNTGTPGTGSSSATGSTGTSGTASSDQGSGTAGDQGTSSQGDNKKQQIAVAPYVNRGTVAVPSTQGITASQDQIALSTQAQNGIIVDGTKTVALEATTTVTIVTPFVAAELESGGGCSLVRKN